MKIKECNLKKVISCDITDNAIDIAKKLRDNKERHIIVLEKQKPVGIISTTDINNKVVAENKDLKKTKAKDIMTSKILVKDINEEITPVYIEMIKENIFSCPVVCNGELKGSIDLKELMNSLVKLKAK